VKLYDKQSIEAANNVHGYGLENKQSI